MCYFLISQISFLGQKVCSVARVQTDRHNSEYRRHPFRVSGIFPSTSHQGSHHWYQIRKNYSFSNRQSKYYWWKPMKSSETEQEFLFFLGKNTKMLLMPLLLTVICPWHRNMIAICSKQPPSSAIYILKSFSKNWWLQTRPPVKVKEHFQYGFVTKMCSCVRQLISVCPR